MRTSFKAPALDTLTQLVDLGMRGRLTVSSGEQGA